MSEHLLKMKAQAFDLHRQKMVLQAKLKMIDTSIVQIHNEIQKLEGGRRHPIPEEVEENG